MQASKSIPKQIKNYIYHPEHKIAKGSSSLVYFGQHITSNETVAIKVIDAKSIKTDVERLLVGHEMRALKMLNHQNVIKVNEIYQTTNNIYIVTEYCDQGDLQQYIKGKGKLGEEEALCLLRQILAGLVHVNSKGITHRDMKSTNILLKSNPTTKEPTIKIIDFGFCDHSDNKLSQPSYNVGTPLYMSPESYKKSQYSFKSDSWAVGIVFLEMLLGDLPFKGQEYDHLVRQISSAEPYKNISCSQFSKMLLSRMLNVEVQRRIDPGEVLNLLMAGRLDASKNLGQTVSQQQQNKQSNRPASREKMEYQASERNVRGSVVVDRSPIPNPKPRDISPARPLLDKAANYLKPKEKTPSTPPPSQHPNSPHRTTLLTKIKLCDYFYELLVNFEKCKRMVDEGQRIYLLSLKLIKINLEQATVIIQEDPRALGEEEHETLKSRILQFNEIQLRHNKNEFFFDLYFSYALEYLRLDYEYLHYLQFWIKKAITQLRNMTISKPPTPALPNTHSLYRTYLYLLKAAHLLQALKVNPIKIDLLPEYPPLDSLIVDRNSAGGLEKMRQLEDMGIKIPSL